MTTLMRDLLKATGLTRNGSLLEATRLIQRALGRASQPAPAARAPAATPATTPAPGSATAKANVADAPYRDLPAAPVSGTAARPASSFEPAPVSAEPPVPDSLVAGAPARARARPARFTAHEFTFAGEVYDYRLYLPSLPASTVVSDATPLPLVVLLHGCKQDAADFAQGTAMNALAERDKCMVLYPEQQSKANSMRCWNWFETAHQVRDTGEPGMIAALTRKVIGQHHADPARVYVAGLSAGGAMAAVVAGLYPELFAAVGVHSGLPSGAATDVMSAFSAMRRGARQSPAGPSESVIPTIVFHGKADRTVHPDNGKQIVASAVTSMNASGQPLAKYQTMQGEGPRTARHTRYLADDGTPWVEHWEVATGPHGWSGGDAAGSYTDPAGPSASDAMLAFFLRHKRLPDDPQTTR